LGHDCLVVHLTLLPYLSTTGELKTKPTQHSVKLLLESGVQPDILVCRAEHHINKDIRRKIALFCNVAPEAVIEACDASTIYEVPLLMEKEKLDLIVMKKLGLEPAEAPLEMSGWKDFIHKLKHPKKEVSIGLIGKYVELKDSYKSIAEAFIHAGVVNDCKVKVDWIHSETLTEESIDEKLKNLKGILVAPGFGSRGIEGKILAIKYAREHHIPFLGVCLGMQCAVIEFARNVLGLKDAHSREMNPATSSPVIDMMEAQKDISHMGGTMRLGSYPCHLEEGSLARSIYGKENIRERHRHRYEFNNEYKKQFSEAGMLLSGINPNAGLVEIIELAKNGKTDHPFFIGVQFHPEYKSTVEKPHPLFTSFVKAAIGK
ncbi:MAG TPA: CTP synthase, partial [Bacteroidia bacterium]|nr:CTP synthase [Bacteroidia bacterium]